MALEQMPVTLMIIAVTVAVSLSAWRQPGLMRRLIHWPPAVARGEWWRLISHGFIHADGAHLAFNMITLFFFGGVMERVLSGRIGAGGFLLFYLAGIAIAALPSQWRHRSDPRFMSLVCCVATNGPFRACQRRQNKAPCAGAGGSRAKQGNAVPASLASSLRALRCAAICVVAPLDRRMTTACAARLASDHAAQR